MKGRGSPPRGASRRRLGAGLATYVLLVIPLTVGLAWGALHAYRAWFDYDTSVARGMLPERVGTTGWAQTGSDATLLIAMIGRGEACGGAILALDATTLRGLRAQGLAFLAGAQDPRVPDRRGERYNPWAASPVSGAWDDEGFWPELECMHLGATAQRAAVSAAKEPGSFYTQMEDRKLLISPDLGVVVATHGR